MFPLGLYNGGPISFPVLNKNGTFLNFYDIWVGGRKYPVDMAGFAVNVRHFVEVNFNIVIPGINVNFILSKCLDTSKPLKLVN
jgi:hypothetical protein